MADRADRRGSVTAVDGADIVADNAADICIDIFRVLARRIVIGHDRAGNGGICIAVFNRSRILARKDANTDRCINIHRADRAVLRGTARDAAVENSALVDCREDAARCIACIADEIEGDTLHIELVQKSFKYYLTIRVTGLYNIHSAKMNISGMYTTAYLTHETHRMDEAGTQSLDLELRNTATTPEEREAGVGELYGEFWSFGPHAREDIQNSITLYFINGDVVTKKLSDLTSQIKKLVRGGEIIVEEIIDIKGPAGGFDPGVGDWNDTNVDLYL